MIYERLQYRLLKSTGHNLHAHRSIIIINISAYQIDFSRFPEKRNLSSNLYAETLLTQTPLHLSQSATPSSHSPIKEKNTTVATRLTTPLPSKVHT